MLLHRFFADPEFERNLSIAEATRFSTRPWDLLEKFLSPVRLFRCARPPWATHHPLEELGSATARSGVSKALGAS